MKRSLIFFLSLFLFIISDKKTSALDKCADFKVYNNLSTINYKHIIDVDVKDIKKICTNDICTHNLDNNYYYLIKRHINNVVNSTHDIDLIEAIKLKGIKIDKVHFNYCN